MPHLVKQPLDIIGAGIEFPLKNLHTFFKKSLGQIGEHRLRRSKNCRLYGKEGVIGRVRDLRGKSRYYAVLEKKWFG